MSVRSFQTIVDDHAALSAPHRRGLKLAPIWHSITAGPMFQCPPTGILMMQEFDSIKEGFCGDDFRGHNMYAPEFMPGGSVDSDYSFHATAWICR